MALNNKDTWIFGTDISSYINIIRNALLFHLIKAEKEKEKEKNYTYYLYDVLHEKSRI